MYKILSTTALLLILNACGNSSITSTTGAYETTSPSTTKQASVVSNTSLPTCDENDPNVQMIETADDWDTINIEEKTIFCVSPGDYTKNDKRINLTTSGTEERPRYILLNNGNDKHPALLDKEELAKYRLTFNNVNYWTVDRQADWENTDKDGAFVNLINSDHNHFRRGLLKDTASGIYVRDSSSSNIIESHHFEKTQWSIDNKVFDDNAAINLFAQYKNEKIKNTYISNNEIINYVDAVQTVRIYEAKDTDIDFQGTVIENNNMYVTPIMYKVIDGTTYSYTENAIDLKGGSLNSYNPIIIQNNRMSGYKPSVQGLNLSDTGSAIVTHYDVKNVIIKDNYIFDSDFGITSGASDVSKHSLENATISNNVFYNIKHSALTLEGDKEKNRNGVKNINIKENRFLKCGQEEYALKIYHSQNVTLTQNIFADNIRDLYIPNERESKNLSFKNNTFYLKDKSTLADNVIQENNEVLTYAYDYDQDMSYTLRKFDTIPQTHQLFQ
ncbi:MAG: hypothetical protein L3J43_04400 [Sulfurovum sp.]|nr:hypothetical protein [Sulfurovum sp.]